MNFRSAILLLTGFAACAAHAQKAHRIFHIQAGSAITQPISGRLLLFMQRGKGDAQLAPDALELSTHPVWIAAQEIHDLQPGGEVDVDADIEAYPQPFSRATGSGWEVQAVLDVNHTYNYSERIAADWESTVVPMSGAEPVLTLNAHSAQAARQKAWAAATGEPGVVESFSAHSDALTHFWGKPTDVHAWVVLPPGYEPHSKKTWPTVYWSQGFTGNAGYGLVTGKKLHALMIAKKMAPMIWVMLDESLPEGTHEFADSANDGPWGTALVHEFIPAIEKKYRMDARPDARFLNGHSSGGWASLQLELNYPEVFGGAWPTSPDPGDFHSFFNIDLYAPNANMYRKPDGTANPFVRLDGKVTATFEAFTKEEVVLGPYGGQMSSFEWVFSPKGADGAPVPMFDRVTGAVDPQVVQYWHDHYDLAVLAEKQWPAHGKRLKGRIHLWVGSEDTCYLEGPAHALYSRLQALGAEPHFTFIPGASHMNVYQVGNDPDGLWTTISQQMDAVAHPHHPWSLGQ